MFPTKWEWNLIYIGSSRIQKPKLTRRKEEKKMYKSGTSKNVSIQQPQFENLNDTVFLK